MALDEKPSIRHENKKAKKKMKKNWKNKMESTYQKNEVGEKKSPLFSIPPSSSSNMHESHILLMKLTTSPALPEPEEKSIVNSSVPIATKRNSAVVIYPMPLTPPENNSLKETGYESRTCEPLIEEPATPEQKSIEIKESDIKDSFYEDYDEITTIKLNSKEFTVNLQNYIQEKMTPRR